MSAELLSGGLAGIEACSGLKNLPPELQEFVLRKEIELQGIAIAEDVVQEGLSRLQQPGDLAVEAVKQTDRDKAPTKPEPVDVPSSSLTTANPSKELDKPTPLTKKLNESRLEENEAFEDEPETLLVQTERPETIPVQEKSLPRLEDISDTIVRTRRQIEELANQQLDLPTEVEEVTYAQEKIETTFEQLVTVNIQASEENLTKEGATPTAADFKPDFKQIPVEIEHEILEPEPYQAEIEMSLEDDLTFELSSENIESETEEIGPEYTAKVFEELPEPVDSVDLDDNEQAVEDKISIGIQTFTEEIQELLSSPKETDELSATVPPSLELTGTTDENIDSLGHEKGLFLPLVEFLRKDTDSPAETAEPELAEALSRLEAIILSEEEQPIVTEQFVEDILVILTHLGVEEPHKFLADYAKTRETQDLINELKQLIPELSKLADYQQHLLAVLNRSAAKNGRHLSIAQMLSNLLFPLETQAA